MEPQKFVIDIQEIKVAVDIVIFSNHNNKLHTLLVKRKYAPFENQWAFPGGFFDDTEELEDAVLRELKEEANVSSLVKIEQIGAFGKVNRDPRRRVISIAYLALTNELPEVKGDTDASEAQWFSLDELPLPLAFDHDVIITKAINILKDKVRYTKDIKPMLPSEFSKEDLENLYKLILKEEFNEKRFNDYLNNDYYIEKLSDNTFKFAD